MPVGFRANGEESHLQGLQQLLPGLQRLIFRMRIKRSRFPSRDSRSDERNEVSSSRSVYLCTVRGTEVEQGDVSLFDGISTRDLGVYSGTSDVCAKVWRERKQFEVRAERTKITETLLTSVSVGQPYQGLRPSETLSSDGKIRRNLGRKFFHFRPVISPLIFSTESSARLSPRI